MDFAQLEQACKLFGLHDRASLKEIKTRHKQLVLRHHPDTSRTSDDSVIKEINEAYRLLSHYCANYRFSFSKEEFFEQNPEERLREQFAYDPVWGGTQAPEDKLKR
ncbi:MAG: J domain-containing protein [Desulfuromonadaceae bacterium]|nr:J domain-containing protein [Desulfuromonadaceae bacterium]